MINGKQINKRTRFELRRYIIDQARLDKSAPEIAELIKQKFLVSYSRVQVHNILTQEKLTTLHPVAMKKKYINNRAIPEARKPIDLVQRKNNTDYQDIGIKRGDASIPLKNPKSKLFDLSVNQQSELYKFCKSQRLTKSDALKQLYCKKDCVHLRHMVRFVLINSLGEVISHKTKAKLKNRKEI